MQVNDLQRENRRSVNKLQEERMISETDVSEYNRLTLKGLGMSRCFAISLKSLNVP